MSPTPPQVNTTLIKQRLTKGDVTAIFARIYPPGSRLLSHNVSLFWFSFVETCSQLGMLGNCKKCRVHVGTCECIPDWKKWAMQQPVPTGTLFTNRKRLEQAVALRKHLQGHLQLLFRELHTLGCEPTSV